MQRGGCHPVDGCQDGTPFGGAAFTYLAANVTLDPRRADPKMLALAGIQGTEPRPLLPAYTIREIGGVRVGIIGLIVASAPSIIMAASARGLVFEPEAIAANKAAGELRQKGVRTIVVVMHQGGEQRSPDVNACVGMSSELVGIVDAMSVDIDVVVSGHTHQAYNCMIDGKLVTSAASNGRLVTDIDLKVRRADGEVVEKTARNIIVTRDVEKDQRQTALLSQYEPAAEKISNRIVGSIAGTLTRDTTPAGESALGDVVADALWFAAQRTPDARPDLAVWNPGGIRADLVARPHGQGLSPVTFAQVFAVLPFGNELIVKSISGESVLAMLEQQFGGANGASDRVRIMQVSRSLSYAYDSSRPFGERVDRSSIRINDKPLVLSKMYRLATSNFLWGQGEGLSALTAGADPVVVGIDNEILADFFRDHSPVSPPSQNRIRRIR